VQSGGGPISVHDPSQVLGGRVGVGTPPSGVSVWVAVALGVAVAVWVAVSVAVVVEVAVAVGTIWHADAGALAHPPEGCWVVGLKHDSGAIGQHPKLGELQLAAQVRSLAPVHGASVGSGVGVLDAVTVPFGVVVSVGVGVATIRHSWLSEVH
jgi:hypothetical protein